MKPRAKTIQQRFGFNDDDLKTITHDKIILRLLTADNAIRVLMNTVYRKNDIDIKCCCEKRYEGQDNCVGHYYCAPLLSPLYLKYKEELSDSFPSEYDFFHGQSIEKLSDYECPFYKKETESFDRCPEKEETMRLYDDIRKLTGEQVLFSNRNSFNITTEVPITTNSKYIVGFIDIVINYSVPLYLKNKKFIAYLYEDDARLRKRVTAYIEVKTKIDSFGEIMRQLNMYRNFVDYSDLFILVTPPSEFKKVFESQKIHVYEWSNQMFEEEKQNV